MNCGQKEDNLKYAVGRNKLNNSIKYAKTAYNENPFRETLSNITDSRKGENMALRKDPSQW